MIIATTLSYRPTHPSWFYQKYSHILAPVILVALAEMYTQHRQVPRELPQYGHLHCSGWTCGSFRLTSTDRAPQKAERPPSTSDLACRSCGLSVLRILWLFFFLVTATFLLLMSQNQRGRAIILSALCFTKSAGTGRPSPSLPERLY